MLLVVTGIEMTELIILTIIFSGLFSLGYYLGNQVGRTAHIRDDLRRAREENIVARIQNQ